jgi:hypothetical protein
MDAAHRCEPVNSIRMTGRASTLFLLLLAAVIAACGREAKQTPELPAAAPAATGLLPAASTRSLCSEGHDAFLVARLRGAIDADIDWRGPRLECEGGMRPDGRGVRAAFAGDLPAAAGSPAHRLRFIFGVGLEDTAPGKAQVLPVNLTVILEGEETLYSTRGDDRCSAEIIDRRPLSESDRSLDRISVRGYCLAPAEDAAGQRRMLVPTFEFTGVIRTGEDP